MRDSNPFYDDCANYEIFKNKKSSDNRKLLKICRNIPIISILNWNTWQYLRDFLIHNSYFCVEGELNRIGNDFIYIWKRIMGLVVAFEWVKK